jgi:hypothetical protein
VSYSPVLVDIMLKIGVQRASHTMWTMKRNRRLADKALRIIMKFELIGTAWVTLIIRCQP